jgi:streptogramin lyase
VATAETATAQATATPTGGTATEVSTPTPTITPFATPTATGLPACCPQFAFQWGSAGTGNGLFESDDDLAVDSAGNVYVTDTGDSRIEKFDANGDYLTQWPTASQPEGIAVGPGNTLYVVEGGAQIQTFSTTGVPGISWGSPGTGNGQFTNLIGVAVDGLGDVFTLETGSSGSPARVQKFNSSGFTY